MRKAGTILCILLVAGFALAGQIGTVTAKTDAIAAPALINYQGYLTDAAGAPINGNRVMDFSIFNVATGGTAVWGPENWGTVTVTKGVFNVILGTTTPITTLPDGPDCYLEISVAGVTIAPRVQLVSSPYAMKSNDADKTDGEHAAAFEHLTSKGAASGYAGLNGSAKLALGTIDQGGASSAQVLTWSGSAWAPATVSAGVTGSGTTGYLPRWTGSSSLGNSSVQDDASGHIGVGAAYNTYYGVYGYNNASGSTSYAGIYGYGYYNGVYGYCYAYSTYGVLGAYNNGYPTAVYGYSGSYYGVYGYTGGSSYSAVYGYGYYYGVTGYSSAYSSYGQLGSYNYGYPTGVYGYSGSYYGVYGYSGSASYPAVYGYGYYFGVTGYSSAVGAYGTLGKYSSTPYCGVYGYTGSGSGTSYCGVYGYGPYVGTMGYSSSYSCYGVLGWGAYSPYSGVYGYTSSGSGNSYCGVYGYGPYVGVMGYSSSYGTYGILGAYNNGYPAGVYGYGASYYGMYGYNSSGYYAGIAYSSYGIISNGTKSCVIATSEGNRAMYCPEAPQVLFEDVGSSHLVNGSVRIQLDPLLLQAVVIDANHPLRVFTTLTGDCNGVYVTTGKTYFEVLELNNGKSNATFDWRIVASRKGFEDKRLEKVDFAAAPGTATVVPVVQPEPAKIMAPEHKTPDNLAPVQPNVKQTPHNQ